MDRRSLFKSLAAAPASCSAALNPRKPSSLAARSRGSGSTSRRPSIRCSTRATWSAPSRPTSASPASAKAARRTRSSSAPARSSARIRQYRGDLAGDVHRLVLSAGAREDARHRRAGPGAVGHQGQGARLPVHELLGGMVRNYCECYGTTFMPPPAPGAKPCPLRDRAKAAMDAGYRAFRMGAADLPIGSVYNTHEAVNRVIAQCKEVREGVGPNGDWCIDFHQRFDLNDALRAAADRGVPALLRRGSRCATSTPCMDLPMLRQMTTVPLTARRGVGPPLGLQQAGGEPRHRLHPRHAAQRRRHHRDDEDRGDLRDPLRRHRPALHRARSPPRRWSTASRPSPAR